MNNHRPTELKLAFILLVAMLLMVAGSTAAIAGTGHAGSADDFSTELLRVFTFQDYNTRVVVVGTTLLGLAAGLIGVFIAARATFAAEVAGCQAETGAGGSMAAAGHHCRR